MTEGMWIAIITVSVPLVLSAFGVAIVQTIKYVKAQAKLEALYEQSTKTVDAKNREIDELKEENQKLWTLIEGVTS